MPHKKLNLTNLLNLFKRKQTEIFMFCSAFEIVLLFERHQDCSFRLKISEKLKSFKSILILWKINATWLRGERKAPCLL